VIGINNLIALLENHHLAMYPFLMHHTVTKPCKLETPRRWCKHSCLPLFP